MNQKCKSCNSCGMPMETNEDFALSNTSSDFCRYCVDNKGKLLTYEQILENNASYFQESQGITQQAAVKMAADLLKTQPAWKNKGV